MDGERSTVVGCLPACLSGCCSKCATQQPRRSWRCAIRRLPQALVAADAQLEEVLVGMAADEVEAAEAAAAEAAAAEAAAAEACSEAGGGDSSSCSSEYSPTTPSCWSTASEPCSAACLHTEGSRRALICLLLRSMARSAYITATPGPAAAFLRRFASLAEGPRADEACTWFAQRLLLPVLRLLAITVAAPDLDWVRWAQEGQLQVAGCLGAMPEGAVCLL